MKKVLQLICAALFVSAGLLAQPANDNCATATSLDLAADANSVVGIVGDTRGGTGDAAVPDVCSGTWFADDIWYELTLPNDFDGDGFVVQVYFGTEADDVLAVGMALYESCDADASPMRCFSSSDAADDRVTFRTSTCLIPGNSYKIRVWSGVSATDNSGTFRIGAYPVKVEERVVYEETFATGFNGWTTAGLGTCADPDSNANAVWKWLPDGVLDQGSFSNPGVGVQGFSFCDGAIGVDADYNDNLGGGLDANQLPITPGPCQRVGQYIVVSPALYTRDWNVAGVSLQWVQGHRNNASTYFFSTRKRNAGDDWSEWNNVQINQDIVVNSPHVATELSPRFFLGGAVDCDSLQIRFVYNGSYYYWGIDDVRLLETEAHNMRSQSNFYAIAPNLFSPINNFEPFYGLNDLYNAGAVAQTNVGLNLKVWDSGGTTFYDQTLLYGTIDPDSLAENESFPTMVNVPSDMLETYTGQYFVFSDSTLTNDFDTTDNYNTFEFGITNDMYAKENEFTRSIAVNNAIYDPGAPLSYAYGNYYYSPNGSTCEAESIIWGLSNADELAGVNINVTLSEWTDANNNQIAEAGERVLIAAKTVTLTGNEGENAVLDTELDNFNAPNPNDPIVMKDNQGYLAMVEYNDESGEQQFFFLLASEMRDYGAVMLSNAQSGMATYASALQFSPDGNIFGTDIEVTELDVNDNRIYFGTDLVPMVRLKVKSKDPDATSDPLSADNIVEVYPNPAQRDMVLNLELTELIEDVRIVVTDVTGKTMEVRTIEGVQQHKEEFDVSEYPAGAYLMQIQTESGSRTKRFVVQR